MGVIEEFLTRYRKEFDFYDQAARMVAMSLETNLRNAGIRAIVTSRAKNVAQLEPKVRARAGRKKYEAVDDIYEDIVDLAGARVALYFPAQYEQVGRIVQDIFAVIGSVKTFPDGSTPKYRKRFAGYIANHYRIRLRETSLSENQKRYSEAKVEVQVASVLMHAWAEVEHDLVYKPTQGRLSDDEYAILDELNGLVMAGEIALERLQRAGEARIASKDAAFSNHYELAAYLLEYAASTLQAPLLTSAVGRVDVLFALLERIGLATPAALAPYIANLHGNVEQRPLSEQIIDRLLTEDTSRYAIYEKIRTNAMGDLEFVPNDLLTAIGYFIQRWIELEREVARRTALVGGKTLIPTARALQAIGIVDGQILVQFDRLRRIRNDVVHGTSIPTASELNEAAKRLEELLAQIKQIALPHP